MLFSFGSKIYQILQRLGGTRTAFSITQSRLGLEKPAVSMCDRCVPWSGVRPGPAAPIWPAREGALGFPTPSISKLMTDPLFQNALILVCQLLPLVRSQEPRIFSVETSAERSGPDEHRASTAPCFGGGNTGWSSGRAQFSTHGSQHKGRLTPNCF